MANASSVAGFKTGKLCPSLFRLELASEEEIQELENRSREAQQNRELEMQQEQIEPLAVNDTKHRSNQPDQIETIRTDGLKLGRNEIVIITDGKDTKELKYKKAKPLIDSGKWKFI